MSSSPIDDLLTTQSLRLMKAFVEIQNSKVREAVVAHAERESGIREANAGHLTSSADKVGQAAIDLR